MKFETRRESEARLKRQKRSGIMGIVMAFALVLVLGAAMWYNKKSLEKKNEAYQATITQLQAEIEQQQSRADELEEYKKYIQTKKFVEEMAKDKFGLIYPDELVFKPEK
jgi:cell division protein FtsB